MKATFGPRSAAVRPSRGPLSGIVESISYLDAPGSRGYERVLPGTGAALMISLGSEEIATFDSRSGAVIRSPAASIVVPRAEPTIIDTGPRRHVTVSFVRGTAARLFGVPLTALAGERIPLEVAWGRGADELTAHLLDCDGPKEALAVAEEFIGARLPDDSDDDDRMAYAASMLALGWSVNSIGDEVGLLPRAFTTRFREATGLGPKVFARVHRLQRVLRSVHGDQQPDWARVAVEHGFFDQAHLINDFRSLTGLTPGAYSTTAGPFPNHVPLPDTEQFFQ